MTTPRFVGKVNQGTLEKMAYDFDFTKYGTPTAPAQHLFEDEVDVTATKMEVGAPTILGNIVTSTRLISLTPGKQYRFEVLATIAETGNLEGMYILITAEL